MPGGVSQRGGAPGTSETDLLHPLNMVDKVNAIVLSGGSAYGLDARIGVVRYLEEQNDRVEGRRGVVPIVPAAILFDLGFGGNPTCGRTPTAATRRAGAASRRRSPKATSAPAPARRSARWAAAADEGRARLAAITLPNGLVVAAIVATNARRRRHRSDDRQGRRRRRAEDGKSLADVRKLLRSGALRDAGPAPARTPRSRSSPPTPG